MEIFDKIAKLIEPYIPTLLSSLGLLLTVTILSCVALAWLIRRMQRWAGYEEGHKFFHPSTWFKIEPRHHFAAKSELLANEAVRELYAPTASFVRDLRENERSLKLAWLSPFPKAVKAAIRDSNLPKGKKLMARRQISQVAKHIEICSLPESVFVGGDAKKHFRINLATVGKDPAIIGRVEANLLTQLKLVGGIERFHGGDPTMLSFLAHKEKVINPLTEEKIGVEFFEENPANSVYSLPLAITQDSKPWNLDTHHTLIFGQTGSGKGSPIQGAIHQLAPFVKKGIAELHGIDPKNAELRVYKEWKTSLFKRISVGLSDDAMREHAETIAMMKDIIDRRSSTGETVITEGMEEDGRDFEASRENPLILFIIDEFPTLFKGFENLGKDGKKPLNDLGQVILTGRSYGVYLMAATQRGDKTILDSIIDSMTHRITLRQTNPYFNGLFLGDDYKENGNDPALIPKATKSNGYATAGIGYIAEDGGQTMIRFAYISKVEISALVREFREIDGLATTKEEFSDFINGRGEFAITDEDEDEDEELEILSFDDFDDFSR